MAYNGMGGVGGNPVGVMNEAFEDGKRSAIKI